MIPGEALAHWLGDRAAQRRSLERVEASAARWSEAPWITRLDRKLAEAEDRRPEALLDLARAFMDAPGEREAMVADLLAGCRADPFFRPPFHPLSSEIHNSLLLYHHPDLSISLGVTGLEMLASKKIARRGGASINFTGFVTLLRFLKAGDALVSLWEAPEIGQAFSAAEAGDCRLVERRRLKDGEELVIDGRFQSFVIEHARSDILFFQAVARTESAPVGIEYDSDSLAFLGASSTDEPSSRVQMMVSLLRAMDRQDAFPLIEESLAAPQFFTRWHVMREMLAMDAEASLQSLKAMAAGDPHPDVRATAARTLELFFPAEVGQEEAGQEDRPCRA